MAQIDQMADLGIQTVYIQTAHRRSPADVLEPELLLPMIERAHARGMAVVAWYLPELVDTTYDLHKLLAAASLPVDGLGVDIESRAVGDPAERTRRLHRAVRGHAPQPRHQGHVGHHARRRAPPGREPGLLAGLPLARDRRSSTT